MAACSVLAKSQIETEFGATFKDGEAGSTLSTAEMQSSSCSYRQIRSDNKPWTFTIDVDSYQTEALAKSRMSYTRSEATSNGQVRWTQTEMPGIGDDALFSNLVTLGNTQESLVVRKGNVVYHFMETVITGITDSAGARNHLVNLAKSVTNH